MDAAFVLLKSTWNAILTTLLEEYEVFAPFMFGENIEYACVTENSVDKIIYNQPKPASPLKTFFLPFKENVITQSQKIGKRIILGTPACDLSGLSLLDEIYLDKDYIDPNYSVRRESTLLFGFDCHSSQEHCHCTSYGFGPIPDENADLIITLLDDKIALAVKSEKGKKFKEKHISSTDVLSKDDMAKVVANRKSVADALTSKNQGLPDYEKTGELIRISGDDIWMRHSDNCVSCGACSAICPTCSCFLFIERPAFEKVRTIDTCQYPGFERVAAGEDPLRLLSQRFRNRYMCKYVWKPEKYQSKACTGCGRCIEACIGEINKNELLGELNRKETVTV